MGGGQLPLKLSTSYYLSISTSHQEEKNTTATTSKDSDDHLFSFSKPSFKSLKPKSSKDKKTPKQRTKKKVVVKLDWPFISVVRCKAPDVGSSSSSSCTIDSINGTDEDAKNSSLDNEKVVGIIEDDSDKPKWDGFESFHSCDIKITKQDCDEIDLNYSADESESTSTDILKAEAENVIKPEEIPWYGFGSIASRSGGSEVKVEIAPSLRKTMMSLSTRENPHSSLQLIEKLWMPNLLSAFVGRMLHSIEYSHHLFSMMLWMDVKRRVLYKAEKMNVKIKALKGKIIVSRSKEEEGLWKKRILMGNRCQRAHFADSFYDAEGKQVVEYGKGPLELDIQEEEEEEEEEEEDMIMEARVIRNLEYYLSDN